MRRRNYFIIAVVVIVVIGFIFFSNSSKSTGHVICVDKNSNNICDDKEKNVTATANITAVENTTANSTASEYKPYKVKLFLTEQPLANESTLPENPDKISVLTLGKIALSDGKQYYGPYTLYTYLDGVYNEDISCKVEEFYDNIISGGKSKYLADFAAGQQTHTTNIIGYEMQGTPNEVKYSIDCTGVESGITFKDDSYTVDLIKP